MDTRIVEIFGGARRGGGGRLGRLLGIGVFAAAVSVNASLLLLAIAATLLGPLDRARPLAAAATAVDAAAAAAAVSVALFAVVYRLTRRRGHRFWMTAGATLAVVLAGSPGTRMHMAGQALSLDPGTIAALVATRGVAAAITAAMLLTLGQTKRAP